MRRSPICARGASRAQRFWFPDTARRRLRHPGAAALRLGARHEKNRVAMMTRRWRNVLIYTTVYIYMYEPRALHVRNPPSYDA